MQAHQYNTFVQDLFINGTLLAILYATVEAFYLIFWKKTEPSEAVFVWIFGVLFWPFNVILAAWTVPFWAYFRFYKKTITEPFLKYMNDAGKQAWELLIVGVTYGLAWVIIGFFWVFNRKYLAKLDKKIDDDREARASKNVKQMLEVEQSRMEGKE